MTWDYISGLFEKVCLQEQKYVLSLLENILICQTGKNTGWSTREHKYVLFALPFFNFINFESYANLPIWF